MRATLQTAFFAAAFLVAGQCLTRGQSSFQNLDFESATLVPIPGDSYGSVQFAPAFSGWTGLVGTTQPTRALHNYYFLGTSAFSILDHGWPYSGFGGVIQGNYTALLQAGAMLTPTGDLVPADTTLSQTGLVPLDAQSLRFKAQLDVWFTSDPFDVTLGGQTLSLIPLQAGANYTLYAADVHQWAGQSAELDFIARSPRNGDINYVFLDSIQFSNQRVPEPGVLSLSALGAVLLGRRALRRRSH